MSVFYFYSIFVHFNKIKVRNYVLKVKHESLNYMRFHEIYTFLGWRINILYQQILSAGFFIRVINI